MSETDVPADYDPSRYERPSVTVDVVIFSLIDASLIKKTVDGAGRQLAVLLLRQCQIRRLRRMMVNK